MKYRFTRVWANIQIGVGIGIAVLSGVGGVAVAAMPAAWQLLWPRSDILSSGEYAWAARAVVAALIVLVGSGLAIPLIVSGQLIHALLDQRAFLARISRRLRRWEENYVYQQAGPPLGSRLGRTG